MRAAKLVRDEPKYQAVPSSESGADWRTSEANEQTTTASMPNRSRRKTIAAIRTARNTTLSKGNPDEVRAKKSRIAARMAVAIHSRRATTKSTAKRPAHIHVPPTATVAS